MHVYGFSCVDFRGWQLAKLQNQLKARTWQLCQFCMCEWFFPDMIRNSGFERQRNSSLWYCCCCCCFAAATSMESIRYISFLFILTRISNRTLFLLWMCYLFIWQWVLRITLETLKFSRSMFCSECESVRQIGLSCDKLWFWMCLVYVGDSREWRFIPYSTHSHSHKHTLDRT